MIVKMKSLITLMFLGIVLAACASFDDGEVVSPASALADTTAKFQPQPYVKVDHPDWADDAIIYQINTRQFTEEGTFKAAQRQLPRLKGRGGGRADAGGVVNSRAYGRHGCDDR